MIKYYYRIHEKCGTSSSIPNVSNETCLNNFIKSISSPVNLKINIDSSNEEFKNLISTIHPTITETSLGNGLSFLKVLNDAINENEDEDIIYFVENDYLHLPNIDDYIIDGFKTGATFVTLYDHLDKYTHPNYNDLKSKIILGNMCHWRTTPSTCMTFASKVKTLKKHKQLFFRCCNTPKAPEDHQLFTLLQNLGNVLVSCVPGRCTHGENTLLSPFVNWRKIS